MPPFHVFFKCLWIINCVLNFSFDFSAFPPMFFLFTASCILDVVTPPPFLLDIVRALLGLLSKPSESSAEYRELTPLLPASWLGIGKVLLLYVIPSDYPLSPPGVLPHQGSSVSLKAPGAALCLLVLHNLRTMVSFFMMILQASSILQPCLKVPGPFKALLLVF